jgi:hypothetical protein
VTNCRNLELYIQPLDKNPNFTLKARLVHEMVIPLGVGMAIIMNTRIWNGMTILIL